MQNIQFSGLNFDDEEEIKRIARVHQSGPLDWIEGYEVSEEAVEKMYTVLDESRDNPKMHVIVARDAEGNLVGFHWVNLDKEDETSAHIHSLWVAEQHRRKGVAKKLKSLGEDWMREQGAKRVTTAVFYVNKKMIELNLQAGFVAGQVEMTKEL